MSSTEQTDITFFDIFIFLEKYWKRTMIFAAVSFLITLLVIALAYLWIPRTELLTLKIFLNLRNKRGFVGYPSGKTFNAEDILSPSVLRVVYNDCNLKDKLKFDEFCAQFSLAGESLEKAKLAAEYREKLANKKNTVLELSALETQFKEGVQKLATNSLQIAMIPHSSITQAEAVTILHQIPKTWFRIYSKEEAKRFPNIMTVNQIQLIRNSVETSGWMVTLDKCRITCGNLQKACREMTETLTGKKVSLPSGEFLNDLSTQLTTLLNYRIRPLLLVIQDTPKLQNPLDQLFIQGRIMALDREIKSESEKYDGTIAAIKILYPVNDNSGQVKTPAASQESQAPLIVSFDGNLFSALATLISDSKSLQYRADYAAMALAHKSVIADCTAERDFYMTLLGLKKRQLDIVKISHEHFTKVANLMFNELLILCAKVNSFRDLIYKDYILPASFYTSSGEVHKLSSFNIPFLRVSIGLFILTALINLLLVIRNFCRAKMAGELERK